MIWFSTKSWYFSTCNINNNSNDNNNNKSNDKIIIIRIKQVSVTIQWTISSWCSCLSHPTLFYQTAPYRCLKYRSYLLTQLTRAFTALVEGELPVSRAATRHGVPEQTLRGSIKGKVPAETVMSGPYPLLSLEEDRGKTRWPYQMHGGHKLGIYQGRGHRTGEWSSFSAWEEDKTKAPHWAVVLQFP